LFPFFSFFFESIVFVAVPIGINTISAFYLISQENKRQKFLEWFMSHRKVASIFIADLKEPDYFKPRVQLKQRLRNFSTEINYCPRKMKCKISGREVE
jgi:hypothetical protein